MGGKFISIPHQALSHSSFDLRAFFVIKSIIQWPSFMLTNRKTLDILMQGKNPVGGKYSFDIENRKKIPKDLPIPSMFLPCQNRYIEKVIAEVEREFPDAIGEVSPFLYPTTHKEAHEALQTFLKNKLPLFGAYQDAIQKEDSFLFHSVLSPLLNIGLLTPLEVIQAAIHHAEKHSIPINSLEGFLRQIMGWREFVRASYIFKGSFQRSFNFFNHHESIPEKFWKGAIGILPIDTIIKRVLKTGYCNHIERLMVLGNFLLLTEISPQEIYKWFMANFVDAYDWVMVPNVFGMSQYADGGTIVTKPYIASSNYITKMSNYPKGEWTEIWDGLFWRFLQKHQPLFSSNYRTLALMKIFSKNESAIIPKIRKAELWLTAYKSENSY